MRPRPKPKGNRDRSGGSSTPRGGSGIVGRSANKHTPSKPATGNKQPKNQTNNNQNNASSNTPPARGSYDKRIFINPNKYPQSAAHINRAQQKGHPQILTKDSASKSTVRSRRRAATSQLPPRQRGTQDRDEYPFASTKEGGAGSSVEYVDSADNQGAGSSLRAQWDKLPQGSRVWIDTVRRSGDP